MELGKWLKQICNNFDFNIFISKKYQHNVLTYHPSCGISVFLNSIQPENSKCYYSLVIKLSKSHNVMIDM